MSYLHVICALSYFSEEKERKKERKKEKNDLIKYIVQTYTPNTYIFRLFPNLWTTSQLYGFLFFVRSCEEAEIESLMKHIQASLIFLLIPIDYW
jgi:hypothetical protein